MSYIGTQPTPQSLESRQEFTATASQTTFATSGYTVGYVDVYLNGVKLSTSDFTATNGSDVVLGSGAAAGDVLAVVMKNDHSDLVALPITDSAGNNVLSESGGTVTLTADEANVGSNALVVDSSGNVGIGTSSPIRSLTVSQAGTAEFVLQDTTRTVDGRNFRIFYDNGGLAFGTLNDAGTAGSERMRIDSSGGVKINNTLTIGNATIGSYTFHIQKSENNQIALFDNSSTSSSGPGCIQTSLNGANQNNTNCFHFKGTTQGVNAWFLYGNGTSSFSSDERLKKNIETTRDGYLDDIKNLRVVKYHWKNQDDKTPKELGLIAQEVEQVFPGLIQEHELENVSEDIKHIKTSVIPFILIKAIQEQQTLIESQQSQIDALTARIETLEATP